MTASAFDCASPKPLIESHIDVGATLDMQHGDSPNRLDMGTVVHMPMLKLIVLNYNAMSSLGIGTCIFVNCAQVVSSGLSRVL